MEVVRDKNDNCIIVCAIENFDAMGVHTGDSITVAPAQTLSDREYQLMRDASIATLREIGVDTGGSNVQFAINPRDGRMIVIEMNPRVSRSSVPPWPGGRARLQQSLAKVAVQGWSLAPVGLVRGPKQVKVKEGPAKPAVPVCDTAPLPGPSVL